MGDSLPSSSSTMIDVRSRMTRRRLFSLYRGWWIVAVGYLSQVVTLATTGYVFSLLILPVEQDLGWSRTQIVGVLTLTSLVAGGLSVWLGPLVDRHGSRLLMTASALLGGACLMLLRFVQEPWQYYLCWAGFGLATPGLLALGPGVAIANWFIRKRPLAFALFSLGSPSSGIVLTPIIAWVVHNSDWRTAWLVMGLLTWGVAPLAWRCIRRRPEDVGLLPDGETPEAQANHNRAEAQQSMAESEEPAWTVGEALRTRSFWLLTLAFMLISFPASSIWVQLAPYVAGKGFSAAAGATTLMLYGLGCLGGRPLWGFLITRLGLYRALVNFGFIYGLSIIAFQLPSSLFGIYVTTIVLGLSIGGMQQLQSQAFPDYFGRQIVGALLGYAGIFLTLTRALAPLFLAFTYDLTQSYAFALTVFAAACFIGGVSFLLAPPPRRAPTRMLVAVPE